MIIDCHNHPDWYGYTYARFMENMDRYQIDKTWLLSWEAPRDEWDPEYTHICPDPGEGGPIPFSRCLALYEKAPDRFVLGYAPDPRRPDAIDRLAYAIEAWGVGVYGELKLRMTYDNPDALRMYRFCGEKGLPVLVHLDYEFSTARKYPRPNWWYGGGIDALGRAAAACPQTVFIGHAPGFWAHISGDDRYSREAYPAGPVLPGGRIDALLSQYPNLYCDISASSGHNALNRDPAFTRDFLTRWQDRVLYGRDFFDNKHQELLASLDLPEEITEKILSVNALRLAPGR